MDNRLFVSIYAPATSISYSSQTPDMLEYALGLWLLALAWGQTEIPGCPPGNSTCSSSSVPACQEGNSTCAEERCKNGTCIESREEKESCMPGNTTCIVPAQSTSRLLQGSDISGNSSIDKPISTTTNFSPSPFLGVIPDQPGSLVVGEVFHETIGPRHQPFSFPRHSGPVKEYAVPGGEPYRPVDPMPPYKQERQHPSVEIHIGGGDGGYGRPDSRQYTHYPKQAEIEIRPHSGYSKAEIQITPHSGYGKPDIEISHEGPSNEDHLSLGAYAKPDLIVKSNMLYGKQGELPDNLGFRKPNTMKSSANGAGKTAQQREYGKPYDPGNAIDYTGYPDTKPRNPFYEGFENMKNLLKPTKAPYYFEDNYQKPIQEDAEEDPPRLPFPPVASHGGESFPEPYRGIPAQQYNGVPAEPYKGVSEGHKGSNKWKLLFKFLTTVVPIGLLVAALTPNILVVSPSEEPMVKTPGVKRSLDLPFGPCGLRTLCEALSESPADFEQFLKAAKEGSTPELKDIIAKAEKKDCSNIHCEQLLELKPTQPTVR